VSDGWERATRHPFLAAVRDGSLPTAAFDTWLAQDHRFVGDLLWFQARLLARAPRSAHAVLVGGAAALVDELAWFEGLGEERGLDLGAPAQPATLGYRRLLERLDGAGPDHAMTALWAVEKIRLISALTRAPQWAGIGDQLGVPRRVDAHGVCLRRRGHRPGPMNHTCSTSR